MNLPHSRESEEALIGAVLINPGAYQEVRIDPDDFYIHRNGWVWGAFRDLQSKGLPIDLVTVTEELDRAGHLADIGGAAYLTKMVNNCPSSLNAGAYSKRVVETAIRRRMIEEANGLAKMGYDESKPIDEAIQEHVEKVVDLRLGTTGKMKTAVDAHLAFAETVYNEDMAYQYNIGGMDEAMGGKEIGTLIVVCSRPGMGKTAFALQAAYCDARNGLRAGVFQLEMTEVNMWQRRVCPRAGVSWRDVRSGNITDEQRQRLVDASLDLSEEYSSLFIDDTPALTTDEIYLKTVENNLDIVYIDHLSLVGDKGDIERLRLGSISMKLKNMAKKLKIPVVLLAQLNRNLEKRNDKRPQLHDLRESGEIEQNADEVLGLYRDSYYTKNDDDSAEMGILKFRNGDSAYVVKLRFDPEEQWFERPTEKKRFIAEDYTV